MASSSSVAVVDIGSNSIKVLVAARGADGSVVQLLSQTEDARISAGISKSDPRLSEEGMQRGLDAIRTLLAAAAAHAPEKILLVATSAVRDARNGADFRARVRTATGHEIRILSGDEEANLIGRGLTTDPALRTLHDFYLFDLGGGSLECLAFRQRAIAQAVSLQLGCVRLTEKFVADPAQPFTAAARAAIAAHTCEQLAHGAFRFALPASAGAVGTGGTVATARAVLGARAGKKFEETSAQITVAQLGELLAWLGALPLEERRHVEGLPPGRADVYPTALTTLITLAEIGGFTTYHSSLHNLRFGLADEALPPVP